MAERWIQVGAALLCGLGSCAANPPATRQLSGQPLVTQPAVSRPVATEIHEPVPPPPPPSTPPVVQPIAAVTTAKSPATQPAEPPPVIAATQPGPIDERVAYAIGYSAGRRIHDRLDQDGRTADPLLVLKGLIDGLGDRDPAYPRQDVQAAFAEFQAYTLQRRAEKMYADNPAFRKRADENLKKSRAILDQNAEIAGVEVRPDGVQVQLLAPGEGRIVGNARLITVKNLRVSLADGTLVKATDSDQTDQFAAADALSSLIDVLRGMKIGSKARVWLPPDKAFGLTGKPPVVGPNQGVEYEFELVAAE
jgi:FKBP-type peptidyl-prolyl cis-trans isomerase